jgi:hypothetical protein
MWDANHAALNWLADNQPQFHAILLDTFERRRKQMRTNNVSPAEHNKN